MILPTRKDERWKYTDLADFNAVADSHFAIQGYHYIPREPLVICSLEEALEKYPAVVASAMLKVDNTNHPFADIETEGLFIYLPDNSVIDEVVHLKILNEHLYNSSRNIIVVGKASSMTLQLDYQYEHPCLVTQVTHIYLDEGASLQTYQLQRNATNTSRIAHTFVQQQKNSTSQFGFFEVDQKFNREELVINLLGQGARANTCGFYHLHNDDQYVDHHVDIIHTAAHTQSEMLYKGILDKKSRAVFNGRLHVKANAQKILAYQANHNLLLSANAEVYSKPELEIYADDVKCKHGASTGQIDEEALFYLQSRGISQQEAKRMLLAGFADDVLQRIPIPGIKQLVEELFIC